MCCQITSDQQDFVITMTEKDNIDISDVLASPERIKLIANLIKIGAYEIN